MRAEDIHDVESLKAWLEARPEATRQRDAVWIAFRAAARVFPFCAIHRHPNLKSDPPGPKRIFPLVVLRCLLSAELISNFDRSEVLQAAAEAEAHATGYEYSPYFSDDTAYSAFIAGRMSANVATFSTTRAAIHEASRSIAFSCNAGGISDDCFDEVRNDAVNVGSASLPLWSRTPRWFAHASAEMSVFWSDQTPTEWEFWRRWWAGVLSGQPLSWELQKRVALIDDAIWKLGPKTVAEEITRIEATLDWPPTDIEGPIRRTTPGSAETLRSFSTSAWMHRDELPATLDAILGYCQLEIDRLQGKNYRCDEERDEAQRQIAVLGTLYRAIERLAPLIRTEAPLTEVQAVLPEKLTRIAVKAFQEWPRKNMDDLVDSTIRGALCGATATGLIMLATPPTVAWSVCALLFGGKKISDAIKAGSESKGL